MFRISQTLVVSAMLCAAAGIAQEPPGDLLEKSPDALKKGIENAHPATHYVLAQKLFAGGQRDEAVFWFYAGQLRFRFHVAANPGLDPSGDPALLASFNEVIGRPINEYAFGDLKTLHATLGRVLDWDRETPNGFTDKARHDASWQEIRAGLEELARYVTENAESIRRQRAANGLENRGGSR